jgi:transcriptional regulator GlxA family with amidase domain
VPFAPNAPDGPSVSPEIAAAGFLARLEKTVTRQKASALLTTSNLRINVIAKACGFARADWFSHAFHVWSGKSPSEYRQPLL